MRPETKIGMHVIFIDSLRRKRPAIITNVFGQSCVNVVVVSDDEAKTDDYGRQIERHTSVCHRSAQGDVTYGNVFCYVDEA